MYDPDIESFLEKCFDVDHMTRKNPNDLLELKFLKRQYSREEGRVGISSNKLFLLSIILFGMFLVEPEDNVLWNVDRSLRVEMLTVHTNYAQLKEDLLCMGFPNRFKI